MEFNIGDLVWYKGKKCEVVDREQARKLYALIDDKGKDVKGEIDGWWVSEDRLTSRDEETSSKKQALGFDVNKETEVWS